MKPNWKEKVVVIIDGLGDCIAATPAISAFRKDFPDTKLYVLTWHQHGCSDVFELHPNITSVFAINGSFENQYKQAQLLGFSPAEICVLDNIVHYAEFCGQCGANNIDRWIKTLSSIHASLIDIYFLNLLGRTPEYWERYPKIYCNDNDRKYDLAAMEPYVLINHSTRTELTRKSWPLENWHALINLILQHTELNVVTIGDQSTPIIPIRSNRYKAIRDMRIREVVHLANRAKYTVCCQSGLAHLFDACDIVAPGIQINVGSPAQICGRQAKNCLVVDQKELFGGHTISLQEAWSAMETIIGTEPYVRDFTK